MNMRDTYQNTTKRTKEGKPHSQTRPTLPPRPLPQLPPQQLPDRALRDLLHKPHATSQLLVIRQSVFHELFHVLLVQLARFDGHNVSARQIGAWIVRRRHTDDSSLFDERVGDEEIFEFRRGDLEAFVFEEFLSLRLAWCFLNSLDDFIQVING